MSQKRGRGVSRANAAAFEVAQSLVRGQPRRPTVAELRAAIEDSLGPGSGPLDDRQLYRWLDKLAPEDPSGAWTLEGATAEEARVTLPVIEDATWLGTEVTRAEAAWMARLAVAEPSLARREHARDLWGLAKGYVAITGAGESASSLDRLVAFRPWLDGGERYAEAVYKGVIDPADVPRVWLHSAMKLLQTLWDLHHLALLGRMMEVVGGRSGEHAERVRQRLDEMEARANPGQEKEASE